MAKYPETTKDTQRAKEFFLDKVAFTLGPVELKTMMDEEPDNIVVVDVRRAEHYQEGHIPSAISLPGKDVAEHLHHLSKDKINIVYCYSQQCHLAAKAAIILAENGFPVMELDGGITEWKNYGNDVV